MRRIYLDYTASTPVDPRVLRAMDPYFTEKFGNPGSLHSFGQEAIAAVDESRETIARAIGADANEIVFTGSATEANNIAIRGVLRCCKSQIANRKAKKITIRDTRLAIGEQRIIVSAVEHESVLETARDLEKEGVGIIYLQVDKNGIIDLEKLREALNDRTVLVSVMYANNEIGTIQPICEISEIIREFKATCDMRYENNNPFSIFNFPLFHIDAAQAFQFLDCDVNKLGVDLMTLSAHKIYGPKGIGVLYSRNLKPNTYNLKPIITGGGQEFGLRSGTENVPSIVGFTKAVELVSNSRELENKRIGGLRDYFWMGLVKICPRAEVNGSPPPTNNESNTNMRISKDDKLPITKLPNILNVYFPNHEAQFLLTKLDLNGVAVSSGSACRSRALGSSYVIEALGYSSDRARKSIRFSFGRPTTKKEIDTALAIIKKCL